MVTRDAKIGLLVGLAFILIVGILLSEHITSANTPQQADLARAGAKVREAAATPVAPEPRPTNLKIDPNPQPTQTLVTRDQLDSPRLPPTAKIELGEPTAGEIKVIRIDAPDPVANAVPVKPEADTSVPPGKTEIAAAQDQNAKVPQALAEAARQNGMELMALGGGTSSVDAKPLIETVTPPANTATRDPSHTIANGTKVKEYIAQPGDSLSRIASRQMGAATPANQAAIVALNPSLQKDQNRILAGVKYLIPADAWAAAMGTPSEPSTPEPARTEPKPVDAKTTTYVVKAGDSLWKIAERELGSAGAIAQIKQLNADVLGESETVKVGMKLKLPAKA